MFTKKTENISSRESKKHKHLLLMMLCCLAVIGAIIILPRYFNIGTLGIIFLLLLCPVLHYFMMRKMHKKDKEQGST